MNPAAEDPLPIDATALAWLLPALREVAEAGWAVDHHVGSGSKAQTVARVAAHAGQTLRAMQAKVQQADALRVQVIALDRSQHHAVATVHALDRRLSVATALLRDVKARMALPVELERRMAEFFRGMRDGRTEPVE